MEHKAISAGKDVPNEINVVIEIPAGSGPVKYEVDKESGALIVDRFMSTAMYYPANYGYVPHTLSDDGDPVDVLVLTPVPLMSGCVIAARPIAMLRMSDEKGEDTKILAVPVTKCCPIYADMQDLADAPEYLLASISHFFEHYKDLEAGKWVKVTGWEGADSAKRDILDSVERYKK